VQSLRRRRNGRDGSVSFGNSLIATKVGGVGP
jgi:hypothetical protein